METIVLVRHAESAFGVEHRLNGDPAVPNSLTPRGEEQARELGALLRDVPVDLCVTSELARARETADLALEGRDVPRLVLVDLNEISFGKWEGEVYEEYGGWAWTHGPAEACPGDGESRVDALRRYVRGYRTVLARPELTALVVGHGLAIRYVLNALRGRDPKPLLEQVPLAEPQRVAAAEVAAAVDRLDAWLQDPSW